MSIVTKKLVVVGYPVTGKTCLLEVFAHNNFPREMMRKIFESYMAEVVVEQQRVRLVLWYTNGIEDLDRLRSQTYPESDVVLIVFSISDPGSFESVESKWIEEVRHYLPNVPVILVGTKTDLRDNGSDVSAGSRGAKKFVTTEMGMKMARKIKAHSYLECSALKNEGVQEVFEVAVKAAISNEAVQLTKKTQCCILL